MSLAFDLEQIKGRAGDAAKRHDMIAAERLWLEVAEHFPQDVDALFSLGFHAQMKGEVELAVQRFRAAIEYSPPNPLLRTTIAKALKVNGDLDGHFVALVAALDADPYFLPAHLMRAESLVELNKTGAALQSYRDVLKITGPKTNWPVALQSELEAAQAFVTQQGELAKKAYLACLEGIKGQTTDTDWERIDEAASILAGTSKPYNQEAIMLHIPRLPAIPFYRAADFDWVAQLEAQSELIIEELKANFEIAQSQATPYVAYEVGLPVNQWAELNHSKKWSSLFFYKNGALVEATHRQFPQTSAILKRLPLAQIDGFCPNVMFSTLAAHSAIPPHTGETNARLVVHLPLIVPEHCRYRVGYEWRTWEPGKVLIFDDSIEHEAINNSDQPRVVLIFDIWHPRLTKGEQAAVSQLLALRNKNLQA
jgi:aspartate beta-hydroxylase